MKKILIIAYYFPPMAGGGVQRVLKFVKYMQRFNYQPVVLSATAPFETRDETLMNDIPKGIKILRPKSFNVYRPLDIIQVFLKRFLVSGNSNASDPPNLSHPAQINFSDKLKALTFPFPDPQAGWIATALPIGLRAIREENIDLIYATTSPNSGLVLGSLLKKLTGKPLVLDYRDPWIQWYFMEKWEKIRWRYRIEKALERKVLKLADKVLNVNEPLQKKQQQEFPYIERDKFLVLPNGFDRDDFGDLQPIKREKGKFRLVYFGKFYAKRSPQPFLTALSRLLQKNPDLREKVEVYFLGEYDEPGSSANRDFLSFHNLEDTVKVLGYLPHREALSEAIASDALLFIVGKQYGSESITTGKIFEYMALSKPVFACVPDGISREIIERTRLGMVTSSEDSEQIQKDLSVFIKTYSQVNYAFQPNREFIDNFDREKLTQRLCKVFDSVLQHPRYDGNR